MSHYTIRPIFEPNRIARRALYRGGFANRLRCLGAASLAYSAACSAAIRSLQRIIGVEQQDPDGRILAACLTTAAREAA